VTALFGVMIDQGYAQWVFVLMSTFLIMSVFSILTSQMLARRELARAAA